MTTFNIDQAKVVRQQLRAFDDLVNKKDTDIAFLLERLEQLYEAIRSLNTITVAQIEQYKCDQQEFATRAKKQKKALDEVLRNISKQIEVTRQIPSHGSIPPSISKALKKLERSALTEEKMQQLDSALSIPEPLVKDILEQYNLIHFANVRTKKLNHTRRNFRLFSISVHIFTLLCVSIFTYFLEAYLELQLPEGFQFVTIVGAAIIIALFLEKGINHLAEESILKKINSERIYLYQHFQLVLQHHIALKRTDQ